MNIMRAFHELTRIAATMHGGCASEYNTPITWQCARNAVRMQRDLEPLDARAPRIRPAACRYCGRADGLRNAVRRDPIIEGEFC